MWGNVRYSYNLENGTSLYGFVEGAKATTNHTTWTGWDGFNSSVQNQVYAFGAGLGVYIPLNDEMGIEMTAARLLDTNVYGVKNDTKIWLQATYNF